MNFPFFGRADMAPVETKTLQSGVDRKRKKPKFGRWITTLRFQDFPLDMVQPGDSRQVQRRKSFRLKFSAISEQYGGEPRKARRKMARAILKRQRQEVEAAA